MNLLDFLISLTQQIYKPNALLYTSLAELPELLFFTLTIFSFGIKQVTQHHLL